MPDSIDSPKSDKCCSSCWHCCLSNINTSDDSDLKAPQNFDKTENMMYSILYLFCLFTAGTTLVLAFWIQLLDVYWLNIFLIIFIIPSLIGCFVGLSRRKSKNTGYEELRGFRYKRPFVIGLIPCSLATIAMDIIRFVLYLEVDRSILDLIFINCKIFYVGFLVLYLWKYLNIHLKESLCSRLFQMHLLGTNVFLWFHEFSIHSTHSLEFIKHRWSETYMQKARFTVKVIEAVEPYLYPLIVQFMLIASGAVYQIWLNVRNLQSDTHDIYIDDDFDELRQVKQTTLIAPAKTYRFFASSPIPVEVSSKQTKYSLLSCGFFFGLLIFAGLICVTVIVLSNNIDLDLGLHLYYSFQIALFSSMVLACLIAFKGISQEHHPYYETGGLEILLLISMLGYLLYAEFSFLAGIGELAEDPYGYFILAISSLRIVQTISQGVIVSRALRRGVPEPKKCCCPSGMDGLMFLLFTNAGLWVVESIFDLRVPLAAPIQLHYYGKSLWRAIKFSLFPLSVLYRFISCTSLLEIILWTEE